VQLWCRDEARVGQKGRGVRLWFERGMRRPEGVIDHRYASAWLHGAVRPGTDAAFALVMTEVGAAAMQAFLDRFAAALPQRTHAALPLDGAGWHTAGDIVAPTNISPIFLPPYGPKPNPVERIWLYPRERYLSLRLFADLDDVIDGCCDAWSRLLDEPGRVASLTDYPYLRSVSIS
jgi:DDE superfamily endonuclease